MNLDMGARIPDLHIGVVTGPDVSWQRAMARARGFSSLVIGSEAEHADSSAAFNRAIENHQWLACRNESSLQESVHKVHRAVQRVIEPRA